MKARLSLSVVAVLAVVAIASAGAFAARGPSIDNMPFTEQRPIVQTSITAEAGGLRIAAANRGTSSAELLLVRRSGAVVVVVARLAPGESRAVSVTPSRGARLVVTSA